VGYPACPERHQLLHVAPVRHRAQLCAPAVPPGRAGAGHDRASGPADRRGLAASPGGRQDRGVCTECGMGRATREEIPELLDLHRQIIVEG